MQNLGPGTKKAQKAIYFITLYSDELVKRKMSGAFGLIYNFITFLGTSGKLSFLLSALSESTLLHLKMSKDTQIAL